MAADGIYVRVREPGHRLVHTFTLAQDAQYPSEVAVEFRDWPVLLGWFAALAVRRLNAEAPDAAGASGGYR